MTTDLWDFHPVAHAALAARLGIEADPSCSVVGDETLNSRDANAQSAERT